MKLYTVKTFTAIAAFIFGLGFLLLPAFTIGLYGNTLDPIGTMIARYFGASLLGIGFLAWSTRTDSSKGVVMAFFLAVLLGLLVSLYDAFAGTHNAFVWVNVIIYLLLTLGFGYFAFMKSA